MEIYLKLTFKNICYFYLFSCEFLAKLVLTVAKMTGFSVSFPHPPAAALNSVSYVKMPFTNERFITSRQSAFLPKHWSLSVLH